MNILLINESIIILKMFESIEKKLQAKIHTTLNLIGIEIKNFDVVIINENILERNMVKTIKKENPNIKLALLIKKTSKPNKDFDFCIKKPFLPIELINILKEETMQDSIEKNKTNNTDTHKIFDELDLDESDNNQDEIDLSGLENDDFETPMSDNDNDLESSLENDLENKVDEPQVETDKDDTNLDDLESSLEQDEINENDLEFNETNDNDLESSLENDLENKVDEPQVETDKDDTNLDDLESSLGQDEMNENDLEFNETNDNDLESSLENDLENKVDEPQVETDKDDTNLDDLESSLGQDEMNELEDLENDDSLLNKNEVQKIKELLDDELKEENALVPNPNNTDEKTQYEAKEKKELLLKTISDLQLNIFEDFDIDINISMKKK